MQVVQQQYDPAIAVDTISEHPDNPNRGDDTAVGSSIAQHGFYGAIVVQRSTGYIIAGNTRYRASVADGADVLPGLWLDVDDDTARRIMLADNRSRDLASYDDEALVMLLGELSDTALALIGTGFDDQAYADLLAATTPPSFDDLEAAYPMTDQASDLLTWPIIRFQLPPALHFRLMQALDRYDGTEDYERVTALLDAAGAPE